MSDRNKVYYFCDPSRDEGLFIAAKTWRYARSFALASEYDILAHISFPEIQGELLRDDKGKSYETDYQGQLELWQLDELKIPYRTIEG